MVMKTRQKEVFKAAVPHSTTTVETITMGVVVDTNDPQQIGRVKIVCQHWGDSFSDSIMDLPWATYVSPFGGQTAVGTRGPGDQTSTGGVSYGMWAIPKVGAQVIVMCLDGDPRLRVYMGCVYNQNTAHTMPHGRFMYDSHPTIDTTGIPLPAGPFTSREEPIEPLYTNMHQSFGNTAEPNYEFRTRAADYSVAGVRVDNLQYAQSNVQDDINIIFDNWNSTQGYAVSRTDPLAPTKFTDRNYDPSVYSITSPGFHSLSMDDRQENCRVRLRTSAGHQILLDDTNERVYIATARGNNWIEMDQAGNIDIFTTGRVSTHATGDINFTSDATIRFRGKQGIHLYSDQDVRIQSQTDLDIHTVQSIRANAEQSVFLQSGAGTDIKVGSTLKLSSGSDINIGAGANLNQQSGSAISLTSGSPMNLMSSVVNIGGAVHLVAGVSGPAAEAATTASEQLSFWPSKVPNHEPYARCLTANDYTDKPEFDYTNTSVGRSERGKSIPRGKFWRR